MPSDTLQAAIQRQIRDGAIPLKEVVDGMNVYALVRDTDIRGRPFISTYATIIGETTRGNVQVFLYAAGTQKRLVPREAIFTRDSAWCRGEPTASVCHARTHCWGIVYYERRVYTRIYPRTAWEGDSALTEEQVLADFLLQPLSFQEGAPGHVFRKEVCIVARRGSLLCVRAEVLLHRGWNEQYLGGYVSLADDTFREEPLEPLSTEHHYVSTFLQSKTLFFAVREAPDVFFIDRNFKQGAKRVKEHDYYLVHDGKIYEVRQCWESQLRAYLRGELSLRELFPYAFAISSAGDE